MSHTRVLRLLLVMFLLALLVASGLLYVVSLDLAATYPQVAHLRLPIYVAVVAGLIPVIAAVHVVFTLLEVVDRGGTFSPRTVALLRRLSLLFDVSAGYLLIGLVGVALAIGQLHPSMLIGWFAAEIVALFLYTLAALLGRLFAAGLELRQENELTV